METQLVDEDQEQLLTESKYLVLLVSVGGINKNRTRDFNKSMKRVTRFSSINPSP